MYWENILRIHGNLPLRLFYHYNSSKNSGELPANVTCGKLHIVHSTKLINDKIVGGQPVFTQTITLQSLNNSNSYNFNRILK